MTNDDDDAGAVEGGQPNRPIDPNEIALPNRIAIEGKAEEISEAELWAAAGFNPCSMIGQGPANQLGFILPDAYVAIRYAGLGDRKPFIEIQKALTLIPNFRFLSGPEEYCLYRMNNGVDLAGVNHILPAGADLLPPGSIIPLPDYQVHTAKPDNAQRLDDIVAISPDDMASAASRLGLAWPPPSAPRPAVAGVPLARHSLLGKADQLQQMAQDAVPLLGEVCLLGQATMWYAPPNAGKTLIGLALVVAAVREQRIDPANIYYVNADDNGSGLAQKARILQDLGVHLLAPSFGNFRATDLQPLLVETIQQGKARGVLVIIDTMKKFASLMDKREIANFADSCRQFVMHGGTILAFAHTNKNPNANGTHKYAGTTDLVEDFDAAYMLAPLDLQQPGGERVVRFEAIKRRGDSPEKAAYAYSTENGLTYEQLLASVEAVTFDKLGEVERDIAHRTDAQLVAAIKASIRNGINTKMQMAADVAKRAKTSGKGVIRVIDRYTGDDPASHHWRFTVGERGKHMFELLTMADPDGPTEA